MKTGNIPSLAFCGEITSFPPCQLSSRGRRNILVVSNLLGSHFRELPLLHLKERYTDTFFKDETVTVDSSDLI